MSHSHHHHKINYNKIFAIGVALNFTYVIIEFIYGLSINSLALIADAGHNLSDVFSLLLAWGANYLVNKAPTPKHTYGYKKSSILAAFFNSVILLVAMGAIILESVKRFSEPHPIPGDVVMIVAGIGVVINAISALLFFSGKDKDINLKGAFLHLAADAAVSLGVVAVGVIMSYSDVYWLDPAVSIIIAIIIIYGTAGLFRDSLSLALDGVPSHIEDEKIKEYLNNLEEIESYHDLHIWGMSTTQTAMTLHVIVKEGIDTDKLISNISTKMDEEFNIHHSTIQFEKNIDLNCRLNNNNKVNKG